MAVDCCSDPVPGDGRTGPFAFRNNRATMTRPDPEQMDRYFTEQVVGGPLDVTLGPGVPLREPPVHGAWASLSESRAAVYGLAARSLVSASPLRAIAGRPFSLPALLAARQRLELAGWAALALAALLLWSVLLWFFFLWVQRG